MDLILGHFADHYLADMSAQDLSDLDDLLALPDQQVYEWITGKHIADDDEQVANTL